MVAQITQKIMNTLSGGYSLYFPAKKLKIITRIEEVYLKKLIKSFPTNYFFSRISLKHYTMRIRIGRAATIKALVKRLLYLHSDSLFDQIEI